jgi:pilus assembly protein CpaB
MKAARLVVLLIAVAAGGVAAFLAAGSGGAPPAPPPVVQIPTVDVLVARNDVGIGAKLSPQDLQWQAWPASTTGAGLVRKTEQPDALEKFTGAIARLPLAAGEPIRDNKVIKANGSGYMAAILPSGMRAVSTEISPETGAGGFILPNDHVDVILSRRDREAERATGTESHTSETILTNIRVLAIDQTVQEKDGQRVVVGRTATLELAPRQAETLAVARQLGTLTLALRSIADSNPSQTPDDKGDDAKSGRLNMVRFGVTTSTLRK